MLNFSWRGLKMTGMVPHPNTSQDRPEVFLENNPDPWSRAVVTSPPNPWDTGTGHARNRGRASRTVAVFVLLIGVLLLSAALSHGMLTANSQDAAADTGGPNLNLGSAPVTEQTTEDPAPSVTAAGSAESIQATPSPTPVSTSPTLTSEPSSEPSSVLPPVDRDHQVKTVPIEQPLDTTAPETPPEESTIAAASAFQAPSTAVQCAANVNWRIYAGTTVTSCPFAENVAIAMAANAGTATSHRVAVDSPVTDQSYQVMCAAEGGGSFTCRGGDGAAVILEHRHDT